MAYDAARGQRIEEQRKRHPGIKPERPRSVLKPDERLSGAPFTDQAAPPRSAVREVRMMDYPGALVGAAEGVGEAITQGTEALGQALGQAMSPMPSGPNPGKDKARADLRSMATGAAMAEHAREDPPGQGSNQRPAPPSGDVKKPAVGTGPGAASEMPARPMAGAHGRTSWPKFMKMPDGRVVTVTENRAADYEAGGAKFVSGDEAMASERFGAPQASRFMKDRTSGTMAASQPYSAKVRALANEDAPDLNDPGTDFRFAGGPEGGTPFTPEGMSTMGRPGGPREGYRRLSGIEQALSRRQFLEGRADTEQVRETERAELDRRARLAEQDPLELARIQAQGRMGGDIAKVEMDLAARRSAIDEFRRTSALIEEAGAKLAAMPPGSQEALDLKDYIDYLERSRREMSNLMLGLRLSDPRTEANPFAQFLAATGGGGGTATPGAR